MNNPNGFLKGLKFHIHTFGCQMNENDSEHIAGIFSGAGAHPVQSPEQSDIVVINTCAVREKSEEKLYSLLGRLSHLKRKKEILIGVVGCVAQLLQNDLMNKKPFIDFIAGPDNYHQILKTILPGLEKKRSLMEQNNKWHEIPHSQIIRKSDVSAYITIMEGCDNFCSYCVVPYTRGREKYRPVKYILEEINALSVEGYMEIQLLGQNVNSYRDPLSGSDFSGLLRKASLVEGIEWIRFITSHPKSFSEEIAVVMKDSPNICHQLHLPVQSGSTSVLKRMNRGYTREEYLNIITMLRGYMPDISLSTDIIVGFPGETEKDFRDTLSLLEEVKFTNIFSFRYSLRPRTSASELEDSIPLEVKRKRLITLQNRQKELQLSFNQAQIGQVMKVLCLGRSKKSQDIYSGRNEGYQVVNFTSPENVIGEFVDIKILSCGPYSLRGKRI